MKKEYDEYIYKIKTDKKKIMMNIYMKNKNRQKKNNDEYIYKIKKNKKKNNDKYIYKK